jgi:anaerobic magnesium-protoporphyrin IX monomethyl ester cyclase
MSEIDCFLIGHNEIDIPKHKSLLTYLYGKKSHSFRDRIKYNLSQVKFEGKSYSPVSFYNMIQKKGEEHSITDNLRIITESFNLAIAYLGSFLKKNNLTFDYINSFQDQKDKLEDSLNHNKIHAIAITTTYYIFPYPLIEIITFIRKINAKVPIIIGGPYIANQVRELEFQTLINLYKTIGGDIFIYSNYGVQTLVNVINAFKKNKEVSNIGNIYYKTEGTFKFTFTAEESFSFEEHIVDWKLFEEGINRVVNFQTSISCPFTCNFCNFPKYAGKYKTASLELIETSLKEIKQIKSVTGIQFIDDSLNIPNKRFKSFLHMLLKNNFNFTWSSYFRCQDYDEETIKLMKESGCINVFLGIESGSQTILKNMNKRTNIEEYFRSIELFNKHDILTTASIIVGFPGETDETFQETFDFIEKAKPTFFQQRLWWYDKSTPVNSFKEEFKLEGSGYDWSHFSMNSDHAHDLADKMFLSVKNSIHITEYALVLFLVNRGMKAENVKEYLNCYAICNKEQYASSSNEESNNIYTHEMISLLINN